MTPRMRSMPRLDEILLRFRRLAAPPGLAGPHAVVVDRAADARVELAAVLAAVDAIEDDADRIEAAARARRDALLEAAAAEARRLLEEAERRAPVERTAIVEAGRLRHEAETRAMIAAARSEARRIERAASGRVPELASAVVARLGVPPG